MKQIEKMIFTLRGQRVMMDSDLAKLYGVETKRLLEQVKRNRERFPEDFMFECNFDELNNNWSQFATSYRLTNWKHNRYQSIKVFTEFGVAMLSSVLNSHEAIQINIEIVRAFIRLRDFHAIESHLRKDMSDHKLETHDNFRLVFKRLENLEGRQIVERKRIKLKD